MSDQQHMDPEGLLYVGGEPVGQWFTTDDGNYVLVDFDGAIIDAQTPDGQQLDPNHYGEAPSLQEAVSQEFDRRSHLAEVAERIEQLEVQLAPQPQVDPELIEAAQQEHAARIEQQVRANLDEIARKLGRDSLTSSEVSAVLTEMSHQLEAGKDLNFDAAALEAAVEGSLQHLDEMTPGQRRHWALERGEDRQREAEGEPAKVDAELPENASHEQRVAWGAAKLEGRIAEPEPDVEPVAEAAA